MWQAFSRRRKTMQNPTTNYFSLVQACDIIKYDLPSRPIIVEDNSSNALPKDQAVSCQHSTIFSELNLSVNQQNGDLDNKENKDENELAVSTKF